jgi:tetratricopeptide (TPR) repeat protein
VALAGALLATLCSARASAQQPRNHDPAAEAARPAALADAEALFFAGQKLYERKLYEEALAEMQASHAVTPSPNSRLYIARSLRGLGRVAEAASEYAQAILEAADRLVVDAKYEATLRAAAAERAALSAVEGPSKPTGAAFAAAEARFFAGQKLYDEKQYEPALVEMRASYAAMPSPNSHLYVARCLRRTGRVTEALDEYAQVILEAAERLGAEPRYEATLRAAATERVALRDRIATTAPEQRVGLDLTRSERTPLAFLRPAAYATAGAGVVGLAVWGALGVKASSRYADLLRQCGGRCSPSLQDQVDAGRLETAGSRAGLAVGIVGLAAGATIWTFDYLARKREGRRTPLPLRIAPGLLGRGLVAGGAF